MPPINLGTDPLWQCLCPSWYTASTWMLRAGSSRGFAIASRPNRQGLQISAKTSKLFQRQQRIRTYSDVTSAPLYRRIYPLDRKPTPGFPHGDARDPIDPAELVTQSIPTLYGRLQSYAAYGQTEKCRAVVEHLVKERGEQPTLSIYNALILSNINSHYGAAWRVHQLLEEMKTENLHPDVGTCHAILKVVAVHLDHLLLADTLNYMQERWYDLSEDGAHDVVAALLREGRLEQALSRLNMMREGGMRVEGWLLDMMVYSLCDAGGIDEVYRIMRERFENGEPYVSRILWTYVLDKASAARHQDATALAWNSQVKQDYINPSSGICLSVLATAAQSGDASMATHVFTHLGKRGTAFQPIHYELLISTYLATAPPDLNRAISILTIMPLEKLQPSSLETRSLYTYLQNKPALVGKALTHLRELHSQGRQIPIAALNLLVECYVEQGNLSAAMNLYKLIHTFMPVNQTSGIRRSFANVETFNLLLKGCRRTSPPDETQASFLVSELIALDITPTALTYDRLILVFAEAGRLHFQSSSTNATSAALRTKALELLDWAFRYFTDMQPLGWLPRFGTLEMLAVALAQTNDTRCWDVLQYAEDNGSRIEGFAQKGRWARKNVQDALDALRGAATTGNEVYDRDAGEQRHALSSR